MTAGDSAWPTVAAAAIGAGAALIAALVAKLRVGEKRRWDDELLAVSSGFVTEARWVLTYARRLGIADEGASTDHHRVPTERRSEVLTQTEEHFFAMRALFVRLKLLAPRSAQRSARLMIRHAWAVVEVLGHGQVDHRAEEYPGSHPVDRLIDETDVFIAHMRAALRVRRPRAIFTEQDLEIEWRRGDKPPRFRI